MSELLLTAAQMRALERAAIESGAVTGLELMERAGRGAVEAILAEWPKLAAAPGRAVVLCGPGNNGGDGFVVARLLRELGWDVEVFLYGSYYSLAKSIAGLPPDARTNCKLWDGPVRHLRDGFPSLSAGTLLVDALFGTGLSRPIPNHISQWSEHHDMAWPEKVVALDVPSGLCADSGRALGSVITANLTVVFGHAKAGLYLSDSWQFCGRVELVEIGLPRTLWRKVLGRPYDPVARRKADYSPVTRLEDGYSLLPGFSDERAYLDKGWSGPDRHKYDHGHALVLTGGLGRTGAARLAARGALRVGAGLVTLGAPGAAMLECAAQITALMLRRCEDGAALETLLEDDRLNALCLGPGLGTDRRAEGLVAAAILSGVSAVLDADALTVLAAREDWGLHKGCVLTPHRGEFARLFPDIAAKLDAPATEGPAYSKVDAAREAAARAGCVVLFKGPDTVIAEPDGRAAVNAAVYDRAAPWLATAGSGDVLAGMIAGLLARGLLPFDAACSAAWLHVEAARAFGPGLIAEDLPEMLPTVFAALEAPSS
ncbi:MAG: NAD(P)H-hydrate dehydratase [Pseudomonadota bacterium]